MLLLLASGLIAQAADGRVVSQSQLEEGLIALERSLGELRAVGAVGPDAQKAVEKVAKLSYELDFEMYPMPTVGDPDAEIALLIKRASLACLVRVAPSGADQWSLSAHGPCVGEAGPAAPEDVAPVARSGLGTVGFSRVVFRVDAGTVVGVHRDGWAKVVIHDYNWQSNVSVGSSSFDVAVLERLRAAGFPVRGGEDLLFGQDKGAQARFQLGALVTDVAYDTFGPMAGDRTSCSLTVEWQIFDPDRGAVIFTERSTGSVSRDGVDGPSVALQLAFLDALDAVSARAAFSRALATPEQVTPTWEGTVPVSACPAPPAPLPAGLAAALGAVLSVRADGRTGSGVMMSPEGYALTAAHVVSGADAVTVSFKSGLQLPATVVRADPVRDVALLRLPGGGFPCLPLAEGAPAVGASVFAVGDPVGLSFSVSRGIVSAVREADGLPYVQTDVSVNPGNSGGPLLSEGGAVLGVVSAKLVGVGVEGLAFAVPVSEIARALGIATAAR